MYKGIYWLCLCWLLGHEWEVSEYSPETIRDWQKEEYPKGKDGYICKICKYCRHVEREPIIWLPDKVNEIPQ